MTVLAQKLCPWLASELEKLEAAFSSGRLGHGWIIAGPEGTGKQNLALVLGSRMLRGEIGAALPLAIAPDELVHALETRYQPQDRHPDLHIVWPEEGKRTIGVDAVRAVIEKISLTGYTGAIKVVVIEPAEAMTVQAANALLKSLEEPAEGTHLFLISHCPGRLPATIRSRCQTLVVGRPDRGALEAWIGREDTSADNPLLAGESVGPVQLARRLSMEDINKYSKIDDILSSLSHNRIAAGDALESCRGLEPDLVLEWIAGRLQREIRIRAQAGVSNSVTDDRGNLTENPWRFLRYSRLLDLLAEIARLRRQLDTGLNEQLALEVLLNEVSPA